MVPNRSKNRIFQSTRRLLVGGVHQVGIARSPKATLVTRLQYNWLPKHIARQLPDLPSIIWVEPSSTGISRHRGALNNPG
jgi:hypothetical protein